MKRTISIVLLPALLCACGQQEQRPAPASSAAPTAQPVAAASDAARADSLIFQRTIERARRERLATLPIGEIVVRVGTWFVGAPYTPATLEVPGPEHVVINLREFDCVTYVENMLAFARVIRSEQTSFAAFKEEIRKLRYRDGDLNGYPSRLHYFSEWIANNDAKGIVRNETRGLGVVDPEPIDFMTTHRQAYRQLADTAVFMAIGAIETRLSTEPRYLIPEDRIAETADRIRNGDIIAATSSLAGLDVAHTGIAIWQDGRLHLMHAPLVGTRVEISKLPLAERIVAIEKQDGIMVARPI